MRLDITFKPLDNQKMNTKTFTHPVFGMPNSQLRDEYKRFLR